jgi:hypothetical protein
MAIVYKGIDYLRAKLATKQLGVSRRYDYYEMKYLTYDPSPLIPLQLKDAYRSILGWCGKSVDALADRLMFNGFEDDTDYFDMNGIFDQNNKDILFDSAILGALISSCDFIYISADENGFPRLQVIDGYNATGEIDPITNMLTEGYAVLQRDDNGAVLTEAYFTIGNTDIITSGNRSVITESYPNDAPYALLVPIIYRPDAKRVFGHSRISRASMDLMDKARNTITRAEVSAEFYAFPQKYVVGISQDAEPMDAWKATISSMLQFTKDEDGDHPIVGQFQTASMTPHHEQLKMYASAFAGETGLTLNDLGFETDNPSSADAIRAGHENLRLLARKAQRTFGTGFLNAGYLAACVRDKQSYKRTEIYQSKPRWLPIFEPDASSLSGLGDAINKLQQSFPDYITEKKLENLTGI